MSLHIGITTDPYLPVPPRLYGGIERVVDMLIRGLRMRGHEVTLFGRADSTTPASAIVPYGVPPHHGAIARAQELMQLAGALTRYAGTFDLVHSFGRLAALLPILPRRSLAKVQSYQRAVPWTGVARAVTLAGESIVFTGCSASLFESPEDRRRKAGTWVRIFNGVDVDQYTFVRAVPADAPLMFLGRIEHIKGLHLAIEIARLAGRRLIVAGNRVESPEGLSYFERYITCNATDNGLEYVGPVNDAQKNTLLGQSAALLFPILWPEPFGIVMAEAMACGTPVIGWPNGSVPEVVQHGVNGFTCNSPEDAARAVASLGTIDREAVRRDCEARFSAAVIVDQYENLYRSSVTRV